MDTIQAPIDQSIASNEVPQKLEVQHDNTETVFESVPVVEEVVNEVVDVVKKVCDLCNGTGRHLPEQTCPTCEGTGQGK